MLLAASGARHNCYLKISSPLSILSSLDHLSYAFFDVFPSNKYIRPGDVQHVGLRPTFLAPPGLIWLLQKSEL